MGYMYASLIFIFMYFTDICLFVDLCFLTRILFDVVCVISESDLNVNVNVNLF